MRTLGVALAAAFVMSLALSGPAAALRERSIVKRVNGCRYEARLTEVVDPDEPGSRYYQGAAYAACVHYFRFERVVVRIIVDRRRRPDVVVAFRQRGPFIDKGVGLKKGRLCTPYWQEHGARMYVRATFKRRGQPRIILTTPVSRNHCREPA